MTSFDALLHGVVALNGLSTSPFVLLLLAFVGAYLGMKVVEVIPFTRRIIERREAQAAERQ